MVQDAYRWRPGRGPDVEAIARMRRAFRKPPAPMGEAWFIGPERKTFDRFAETPVAELPLFEFGSFLGELTRGITCFGDADAEWSRWFAYVLPDLILRSHDTYAFQSLLEPTVSAFMNVYWSAESLHIYPQFAADACATLGRCLMKPELWVDAHAPRRGAILGVRGGSPDIVFWGETSGDFSAAMFFLLRYFPVETLAAFLDSVLEIEHAAWRARWVTWLWGAAPLLRSPGWTSRDLDRCLPPIRWENSHSIGPREHESEPFLSHARCDVTLEHLRRRLEPTLADLSFEELPEIAKVMRERDVLGLLFDALF